MRRIYSALFVVLVLFLCSWSGGGQTRGGFQGKLDPVSVILEARTGTRFVPGEIIVRHKAGRVAGMTVTQLGQMGVQGEVRTTSGGETVYRLSPALMGTLSAQDQRERTLATVKAFQGMPDVQYAQPNYIYRVLDKTPNDTRYPDQWHYSNNGSAGGEAPGGIGLPKAWAMTQGDSSIVVAVIDTGILPNHPDIAGSPNLAPGYDMVSDTFMANDGDGRDPDPTDPGDAVNTGECGGGWPPSPQPNTWHGTHVAGTIGVGRTNNALGVAGINWNVKVEPIRVLGKCGGTTTDIADAIRWAAGLQVPGVPNNTTKARVINMSLGGEGACSSDPVTQSAINDAVAQGVTVVVAAGNSAEDASLTTPAGCNNVIAVAASDWRGNLVTRYSNFGAAVKILAPGGDVERDDNGDGKPDGVLSMISPADGSYAYYNGTSMASPHVAGVAALLLACDPSLTPQQILARLQSTALPRNATQCPQACGAGLLNAAAAIADIGKCKLPNNFSLTFDPPSVDVKVSGTKDVTALLRQNNAAMAGKTVSFSVDDSTIATANKATAVTDPDGKAQITIEGKRKGETQLRASAAGQTASAPVKVPLLSSAVLLLMSFAALATYLRKFRQQTR